jgi:hypothetical protein
MITPARRTAVMPLVLAWAILLALTPRPASAQASPALTLTLSMDRPTSQ